MDQLFSRLDRYYWVIAFSFFTRFSPLMVMYCTMKAILHVNSYQRHFIKLGFIIRKLKQGVFFFIIMCVKPLFSNFALCGNPYKELRMFKWMEGSIRPQQVWSRLNWFITLILFDTWKIIKARLYFLAR